MVSRAILPLLVAGSLCAQAPVFRRWPIFVPPPDLTGATTVLTGAINNSQTTIAVAGEVSSTPTVPFVVQIGTEHLRCTGPSPWTCSRHYDTTFGGGAGSAASAANGAVVTLLPWQWINQSGATASLDGSALRINTTTVSGVMNRVTLKQPVTAAATWSRVAIFGYVTPLYGTLSTSYTANDTIVGPVARESLTGKLATCQWEQDPFGWFYSSTYWPDNSGWTGNDAPMIIDYPRVVANGGLGMIRMRGDATTLACDASINGGVHWYTYASATYASLGMTPDEVGFLVGGIQNTITAAKNAVLVSWQ